MTCRKCAICTLLFFGCAFIIAGIVLAVLESFKDLAEDKVKEGLPLKADSKSFENWKEPEGEYFLKYYMFNITNSKDIEDGKTFTPQLEEIGPYTYRYDSTTNVQERKSDTLQYQSKTKYQFDQSRSCKTCNDIADQITTINYPLLSFLRIASLLNVKGDVTAATTLKLTLDAFNIGVFQKRTANELLWGYKDPTFEGLKNVALNSTGSAETYALQSNNSGYDVVKIRTGEGDVDRILEIVEWNNASVLLWWNSAAANEINGTDGTRFKPFIEKDDELYVFVSETCRSLKLTYERMVTLHGIDLYRFTTPKELFQSGDINPENKGFCITGPTKRCLPSGMLDINKCQAGLWGPGFVASAPYFYLGDPHLPGNVSLKAPQKELHETFVDIEPNTGITMRGNKRLQVNLMMTSFLVEDLLLRKSSHLPVYLPLFYTDKSAQISEDDADDFKKNVLILLRVVRIIPFLMIGFGALLLLIAIIISVVHCYKVRKQAGVSEEVQMSSYYNKGKVP